MTEENASQEMDEGFNVETKEIMRIAREALNAFDEERTTMRFALEMIWRGADSKIPYDKIKGMALFGLGQEE